MIQCVLLKKDFRTPSKMRSLTLPAVFTLGLLVESFHIIIGSVGTPILRSCFGSIGTVKAPGTDARSAAAATFMKETT